MTDQEFQRITRSRRFLLGSMLILSASQLFLINGACAAQVSKLAQEKTSVQSADMDHHEHAEGAVDMMIPHQQHRGPHMKWTVLRPANTADAQRAEHILE